MDIGSKIKEIRTKKKISQRKLAEKIGVSGQFISLVEIGKSTPSIDTLNKIADVLEVPINDLLGGENDYYTLEEIVKIIDDKSLKESDRIAVEKIKNAFLNSLDDSTKKSIHGMTNTIRGYFYEHSPLVPYEEFIKKNFDEKLYVFFKETTADNKQEIYKKSSAYIELLLKVKQKESEIQRKYDDLEKE